MERKTIGGFITALRKANGMTQKDLAERLNVSDKTVSRWERDEGTPDLALIPVIAEIFDVTCDELLRGERRSPAERLGSAEITESTPKGEKQLQRLLATSLSQYRNHTYIAMGISVLGLIAAMIGNLAFLRAILGFLLGAICFTVSLVCQAVFINQTYLSVDDTDLDTNAIHKFKHSVIQLAQRSIGLTVCFIGFTFPLVLVDAYVGLGTDSMLLFGSLGAAIFLAIYAIVCYFLNAALLKKGVYSLDEKAEQVYRHNHNLKRTCAITLLAIMAVTLMVQALFNSRGPGAFAKGITFDDYDSFVTFMEQDIPYDYHFTIGESAPVPAEPIEGSATYYDQYGNKISEEEALKRTLKDSKGNVVCEYIDRNETVTSIRYSDKDGNLLPITVFTNSAYRQGNAILNMINACFVAVYCLELAVTILVYMKKRMR